MSVNYDKLRMIMTKYRITGEMLRKETGITTTEAAKINKDIFLTLPSAIKIANYISKVVGKSVRIEDIMDFKDS
jgi:hypothetical protein